MPDARVSPDKVAPPSDSNDAKNSNNKDMDVHDPIGRARGSSFLDEEQLKPSENAQKRFANHKN